MKPGSTAASELSVNPCPHTFAHTAESEKGAHIYSLRRVVATNTEYYAYGTWANMKEYTAHFE